MLARSSADVSGESVAPSGSSGLMLGEIFGRSAGLTCTEIELVRFLLPRPPDFFSAAPLPPPPPSDTAAPFCCDACPLAVAATAWPLRFETVAIRTDAADAGAGVGAAGADADVGAGAIAPSDEGWMLPVRSSLKAAGAASLPALLLASDVVATAEAADAACAAGVSVESLRWSSSPCGARGAPKGDVASGAARIRVCAICVRMSDAGVAGFHFGCWPPAPTGADVQAVVTTQSPLSCGDCIVPPRLVSMASVIGSDGGMSGSVSGSGDTESLSELSRSTDVAREDGPRIPLPLALWQWPALSSNGESNSISFSSRPAARPVRPIRADRCRWGRLRGDCRTARAGVRMAAPDVVGIVMEGRRIFLPKEFRPDIDRAAAAPAGKAGAEPRKSTGEEGTEGSERAIWSWWCACWNTAPCGVAY